MALVPEIFDEALVARRLARVAGGANPPDFLLQRVADDFAERLGVVRRSFQRGAALGAYTGVVGRRLVAAGVATIVHVDDVRHPSIDANEQFISAQRSAVPFAPDSLDLVVSALSLQLVNDLPGVMAQAARALKPDGLFMAAVLGGDTLKELRSAWLIAEEELTGGVSPRVAPFADVRELGGLLQRAGLALPVADADLVTVLYATPLDVMRELKAMGMSNALSARRRTPVTRGLLLRAAEVYQEQFGMRDGRVPATFEIITLTGWKPHESQQKPLRPGSARVSLTEVLKPRGGS